MAGTGGEIHLIFFKGDPAHGDLYYVKYGVSGEKIQGPLRVNSQEGSAVAMGTVRGAQIALGRLDLPHVAWMGSEKAQPRPSPGQAPKHP